MPLPLNVSGAPIAAVAAPVPTATDASTRTPSSSKKGRGKTGSVSKDTTPLLVPFASEEVFPRLSDPAPVQKPIRVFSRDAVTEIVQAVRCDDCT